MTLGIAGFGALASLADYRPYFLGVAFVALGYAHWMAYRRRQGGPPRDGSGRRPGNHERWLWATTVLVFVLAAFPYINPFVLQ